MFSKKADMFFCNPSQKPSDIPGTFSILYLLRRDILQCLGFDPNTGTMNKEPILWPGGMAIFAGIDLLAKFFTGNDDFGKVRKRFIDFIAEYFQPLTKERQETIYQLRNALIHSFGLYSKDNKERPYHFVLTAERSKRSPLVLHTPPDTYQIDLLSLHQQFEDALKNYAVDLNKSRNLQDNFLRMFPNYGSVAILRNP